MPLPIIQPPLVNSQANFPALNSWLRKVWETVRILSTQVFPISVSEDMGNADATLTPNASGTTSVWNTPFTANRTATLVTTNVQNGARFRIVRTVAATGAFVLNVGTGPLKALAAGQWCDVEYDGTAWILTAFGSL